MMCFSTTTCIRLGIHKIELILIDTELKRRSIICLMIGPMTRVGLNSREEKYPNGTLAPWSTRDMGPAVQAWPVPCFTPTHNDWLGNRCARALPTSQSTHEYLVTKYQLAPPHLRNRTLISGGSPWPTCVLSSLNAYTKQPCFSSQRAKVAKSLLEMK